MERIEYFNNLHKQNRNTAITQYRELLIQQELGQKIDYDAINKKIIARWSISGLEYIKTRAWSKTIQDKGKRTYVVAKNRSLEYGVFCISMRDFYATGLVGFGTHEDAENHMKSILILKATPSV